MPTAEPAKDKRLHLREPYRPIPINFLELWEHGDWKLKVYGISYYHQRPPAELIAAAKTVAKERLPASPEQDSAYGVGFLGVHEARDANFIFVDWWANENELRQHVYRAPLDRPADFECVDASGVGGGVWDLQLIWFERNAWVEKVLANPRGPDLEAYLKKRLSDQA